ncbi:GMC oxidoreductase [Polyangium jinanense]|uniref:GMC family oxidoreductase n=1 Tax=Polyangium jinanense TaxID=2829994 RepID=A0A9X3WZ24_9BACT|nr:GMC oxidoreductase [Polyangium jinanense]MDC3953290.1 GMC family oxidoreductase [Polyangium jinanense]MDC3979590.1 GMC family oxidoreductase [Polyangium jinanense]
MSAASSSPNFNYGFPTPGPQTPSGQKVMNHVFFLSETEWKRVREEEKLDLIIIGSGFCALALAERTLDRNPHAKILIIERGSFFLPQHFQNLPISYQRTLGGLSETFPWTLSVNTAKQPKGNIQYQHGMVPFFGGRSTLWSAWCPRPTHEEMAGWPEEVIQAANRYFEDAEKLLNVVPADKIDENLDEPKLRRKVAESRPVYSKLQRRLQSMLKDNRHEIPSMTRFMAAPLAVGAGVQEGLDFAKFSTPAPLLNLIDRQARRAKIGEGNPLYIVTDCVVTRILQQEILRGESKEYHATALETSRGVLNVGDANVVLAMGTLPATTLVLNSFPQVEKAGTRFTSHFITSVVARIPRDAYSFGDELEELELAAIYVAGEDPRSKMQYHVQLSVLSDKNPEKFAEKAARYMPDVVATASPEQLATSKDHLVFVCAVLGEIDHDNPENFFRPNGGSDPTTNVTLQVLASDKDRQTWDTMDEGTFQLLERALLPKGANDKGLEYWHGEPNEGAWSQVRPSPTQRRVAGLVHEGSTLWIGKGNEGVVDLNYKLNGVENVYVTGGGLWPASGSWNPTLTMVALAQHLADKLAKRS